MTSKNLYKMFSHVKFVQASQMEPQKDWWISVRASDRRHAEKICSGSLSIVQKFHLICMDPLFKCIWTQFQIGLGQDIVLYVSL